MLVINHVTGVYNHDCSQTAPSAGDALYYFIKGQQEYQLSPF